MGLALQMWTVRDQMRADMSGCLAEVAAAGFDAVELVGYADAGFDRVRSGLVDAGLRAISQHVPYRRLEQECEAVVEENTALGCSYVVIQQGRHEDFLDADSVRSFAATCNEWGSVFRAAGLSLGYHGYHELDQEFAPHEDGTRWDLFAQETDPGLIFLQLDTYWVRHTGNDPAEMLARFAGRVHTLHLKDTATAADGTDTTVGDGMMALPTVLAAARANGTRWVIVEQEGDPVNAFRDIRRSRQNAAEALSLAL